MLKFKKRYSAGIILLILSFFFILKFESKIQIKTKFNILFWSIKNNQYGYIKSKILNEKFLCQEDLGYKRISRVPQSSAVVIGHA